MRFLGVLLLASFGLSCQKEFSCEDCLEPNQPPVAVAGPDQVVMLPLDSVQLNGSASSDVDGRIRSWQWRRIQGPSGALIRRPSDSMTVVSKLEVGSYQFELMVTDNGGLTALDTMAIQVLAVAPSNLPPVARAGSDTTITLPSNSVILNGSASTDPDNNIISYRWTRISGPSAALIANPNVVQTQVSGLAEGIYQFELYVTDAGGLFSRDTMQVVVISLPTTPPVCMDCDIVFVSGRDGNSEIYTCKADGSGIRRLTNNPATDEEPAWSPDGTKIVFTSDRTGSVEVYTMNADGTGVQKLTSLNSALNETLSPAWSPDGRLILFSALNNGTADLFLIGAPGNSMPMTVIYGTIGWEGQPSWSPDGKRIAFASDQAAYDFVLDVYTMNADGTGAAALTGNMFDKVDYLSPNWSPDGAKLAVGVIKVLGPASIVTQIAVMKPDGTGLVVLGDVSAGTAVMSWSADGQKIYYTSSVGSGAGSRKDIAWISADGSSRGTLLTNGWNAQWKRR